MRGIFVVVLLALLTPAIAQQPEAPVPSRETQMVITQLAQELAVVNKDFEIANDKVKKEFPGWHLSVRDLKLEKDAPAPAKVETPKK